MPRPPDPFKPDEGAVYTNGQVNRAGQLLRRFYALPPVEEGEDAFAGFDVDELVDAMIAVTWWRSLHARPLSRVAANLRYHVAAEDAAVLDRIDVTQRLKRRPTIFNKLEREPTMQLTQMWDIGGVRARLPSLRRDGRLIEVQLRTVLQDAWANQVEEDSRRLATGYKFGRGGEDVHDYYRIVSEAFTALDRDEDLSPDLVAAINENYANVAETLQRRPPRGDR
jgi:hypothetical protein